METKKSPSCPPPPELVCYHLRLYVTSLTSRSRCAIVNVRRLCEEFLPNRYELEIIDIARQPALAVSAQIIAAPTLIKILPSPQRRFIGDMSQTERLLKGLDLYIV